MEKYLYLTKEEWVHTWTQGGVVPLQSASNYQSYVRHRTHTPDEGLDRSLRGLSESELNHLVRADRRSTVDIRIGTCIINGRKSENVRYHQRPINALVWCLCNSKSEEIAKRLGKMACVRIPDVGKLKSIFDRQLGTVGTGRPCAYTRSVDRNHFLKGEDDSWQDEFRVLWNIPGPKYVIVPQGMAERVSIFE